MRHQRNHDLRGAPSTPLVARSQPPRRWRATCMRVSSGIRARAERPRVPSIGLASRSASTRSSDLRCFEPGQELVDFVRLREQSWILRSPRSCDDVVVGGQEFVQRRVDQPDDHRQAVHGAEQAREVLPLAGQQLVERLGRSVAARGHDHALHDRAAGRRRRTCARCGQSDALGAVAAGQFGVVRVVGVGAHRQGRALVGPAEQGAAGGVVEVGDHGRQLAEEDLAVVPSMEIQSPSLHDSVADVIRCARGRSRGSAPTTAGLPNWRATRAAWLVRPPRVVTMPSAASMPCTSSGFGFGPDHDHVAPLASAQRSAVSASKATTPTAAPGETLRPWPAARAPSARWRRRTAGGGRTRSVRARRGVALRRGDQALFGHVDGDAYLGLGGALAIAGLQDPQLARLDGELHVLHVAVVAFERSRDGANSARRRAFSARARPWAASRECRPRHLRPGR